MFDALLLILPRFGKANCKYYFQDFEVIQSDYFEMAHQKKLDSDNERDNPKYVQLLTLKS